MARSEDIQIPANEWTRITLNAVDTITFQNKSRSHAIQVIATAGFAVPTGVDGTAYKPGKGEYDLILSAAFPGVLDADSVWVYATQPVTVFVSHA